MGVDVASFGDAFADERDDSAQVVAFQDFTAGVYKKLIMDAAGKRVLGGMLLGDASAFSTLSHYARTGEAIPGTPEGLLLGERGEAAGGGGLAALPDAAQVCSCNNVSKGAIVGAVRGGACELGELKACTRAGTSCGGCMPQVVDLLDASSRPWAAARAGACASTSTSRAARCSTSSACGASTRSRSCCASTAGRPGLRDLQAHRGQHLRQPAERDDPEEARRPAGHQRPLLGQHPAARAVLGGAAHPGRRDHARRAHPPRRDRAALRALHQDHRGSARGHVRGHPEQAAGHLAGAGGERLRERARLRQGAAHREELRRVHLVPLRHGRLGRPRHPHRGALQAASARPTSSRAP
jgi:bacterioferritin-associated ferredoxin